MAQNIDRAAQAGGPSHSSTNKPVKEESVGHVTSDSLAAESLQRGGDFAEGDTVASSQPSRSTTANVTDTSNADILSAAPDRITRDAETDQYIKTAGVSGGSGQNIGGGGSAGQPGYQSTKATNPPAGAPGDTVARATGPGGNALGSYDVENTAPGGPGAAPSYVSSVTGELQAQKPKGNVTEGGFDPNLPNASFQDNIDTRKDPGRVGVSDALKNAAKSGADTGHENANEPGKAADDKGGFEKLSDTRA